MQGLKFKYGYVFPLRIIFPFIVGFAITVGKKHPNLLQILLFPEVSHKKTVIQKPFTMQLTLNLKCFNKLEIGSQKN